MLPSVLDEAQQQQQQLQQQTSEYAPQQSPVATAAEAAEAAAAAIAAASSRSLARGLGSSHGMRGIRKKSAGMNCKWEMRSSIVYSKPKQYSSWHTTSVEAAVAFDLVKLAVQGEGAAVNLPASVYAAEDVAAMAAFVQYKRHAHSEQLQTQGSGAATPPDQQPQQQQGQNTEEQQLLLKCLTVKAGRQLLSLRPETGLARLQALAAVTGSSSSYLLSRGLNGGNYLAQVLGMSIDRLQDSALAFQQQLGLKEADLQQLLQAWPRLLSQRSDTVQQKVALLLPAFEQLCEAAHAVAAEVHQPVTAMPSVALHTGMVPLQQPQQQQLLLQEAPPGSSADAGLAALQRAALSMPQVLGLKADRVVRRLQVLQQCCCHPVLALQVHKVLQSGGIGRWLAAGEAAVSIATRSHA
jgi:hypothetical protein